MSHSYALPAGAEISHFRLVSQLGAGGMGEVYKVLDLTLDRHAAMKVLSPEFLTDGDRVRRFVQEARSASALNHPNIVTIYEIGQVPVPRASVGLEEDGSGDVAIHFIAMEFIDGNTLRSLAHRGTGLGELLNVMAQVADGLAKAHGEGIVHRDLKPDNIMITNDGYAKIVDFGLAKLTEKHQKTNVEQTASGVVMGTAAYMSPEQVQGLDIDQRSDIFSFGGILYELICGKRPFHSESSIDTMHRIVFSDPPDLNQEAQGIHPGLVAVVNGCLAKEPDDRYQSTRDLASDLRGVVRDLETGRVSGSVQALPQQAPPQAVATPPPLVTPPVTPAPAPHPSTPTPSGGSYRGAQPLEAVSGPSALSSGPRSARISRPMRRRRRINVVGILYKLFIAALLVMSGYLWFMWPDFSTVTVPFETTPAIAQAQSDGEVSWTWLPYDRISPALRRSVVEAMDPDFFTRAVTAKEFRGAAQKGARSKDLPDIPNRYLGMSDISRGAVREGLCSPGNPVRSIEAAFYAIGIEGNLSKRDILEIFLNTAKLGDGIYGVDAATMKYFEKSAKSLSPEEAAILAISLHEQGSVDLVNPDPISITRRDNLIKALAEKRAVPAPAPAEEASETGADEGEKEE